MLPAHPPDGGPSLAPKRRHPRRHTANLRRPAQRPPSQGIKLCRVSGRHSVHQVRCARDHALRLIVPRELPDPGYGFCYMCWVQSGIAMLEVTQVTRRGSECHPKVARGESGVCVDSSASRSIRLAPKNVAGNSKQKSEHALRELNSCGSATMYLG